MNILLVNYEYPPLGGGAGNATMFMARALVQLGHHPVVLTSAFGDLPEHENASGVVIHRVRARRRAADRSNQLQMASFTLAALGIAGRIAAAYAVDASIAFFTIPSAPVAWWLWRRLRVPYVISLRGGDVPGHVPSLAGVHRLLTPLRRAMLRNAIAIVANSDSLGRLAQASDRLPVRVIPNGVDATYFHPAASRRVLASQPFTIVFAGRVHVDKNVDMLLRCIAALPTEQRALVRLEVVGDGPARPALERTSSDLGLASQVTWHGWCVKEDVVRIYQQADCLVNPSAYEGMPNAALEAMACALPVIASDVGGNNDVVVSDETGLLFPLSSPDELRRHISALIAQPALASRLGAAAREHVVRQYSWDRVAEQYVRLFEPRPLKNAASAVAQSC